MRKLLFISLGCDKNLVDSEHMLASLSGGGYEICDDEHEADVIVINTCCFIQDACQESIDNILAMAELKKEGTLKALIVTGCLGERYSDQIRTEVPEVDAVLGTNSYDSLPDVIEQVYAGENPVVKKPLTGIPDHSKGRIVTTGGHYEYLKIAEGCDKRCTYCIIPYIRGSYRSVSMEELVREAEELAEAGVKELNLVAQETTVYGTDLYGGKSLHILLRKLSAIPALRRIRILYCYPEEIYPELVEVIKNEPKICHYLDLPIQHCNDEILKKMGRRTSKKDLEDIISMLRKEIPDICLRTTLITGFPGETEEQHEELLSFVKECRFERLGVFPYSQEDGTPAAEFDGQVDEEVKQRRLSELMEAQQRITEDAGKACVGSMLEVFVEGYIPEDDTYVGRTYRDAPDVDGYIFISSDHTLQSGDMINCRVTGSFEYDLTGEALDEFTE